MSSTHGRHWGTWLSLGLLAPIACFNPEQGDDEELEAASTGEVDDGDEADESSSDGGVEPPSPQEQCTQYCELIGDHCEADIAQYLGQAICEAVCALMDPGEVGDVLGNTAACRAHHAFLAAESADPHCRHAGPTGDTTCGGPCESFCSLAQQACPDDLSPFLDTDGCIAECEAWDPEPRYFATVGDGDTYACRMHHLTLAALQPEVHCGHIATESPVCVDP